MTVTNPVLQPLVLILAYQDLVDKGCVDSERRRDGRRAD